MEDNLLARVHFGEFALDLKTAELFHDGQAIRLSEKPFRLLAILLEHKGELVTRDEIQRKLWPNDTVVDFEHSINTAIKKLRQGLGDSAEEPKFVETIPRRGYRLKIPVQPVNLDDALAPGSGPAVSRLPTPPLLRADPAASLIGKKVWHCRVLEVIGGGGMGLVYKAEDLKLGRQVALKFLPPELSGDPIALRRFEREARTASALNHPNICTVYDIEEYEQQPVLIMELLEGETLRERLAALASAGKKLPPDQLLDIAMQICDGLEAAHHKPMIHRDIKPANIFLTTTGRVKLLDFGLAKLVSSAKEWGSDGFQLSLTGATGDFGRALPPDATLTTWGSAMGTAGYMSPEQVRGEKLDARTDIFSFGLVLYEMAAGQRAFSGETAAVVHDGILRNSPPPLRELNCKLPAKLPDLIEKALQKDREQRWQSMAEIRAELQHIKNAPRVYWKVLAISAFLIAVVATASFLYWRSPSNRPLTDKDTIVIGDFENKTGDPVFDDTLKQGLAVQLEQSPFLALLSDSRVNETLKMMGRAAGERLTPEVTQEVCVRTGSKAMLTGSIAALGSQYVIGIRAVNCATGELLAEAQERAASKEAVLRAVDAASLHLRRKLGESSTSLQKYATSLEQATTSSLEALKTYSSGIKNANLKGNMAALPSFQRAVELDPNFAMPYVWMAEIYANLNQAGQAAANARKAYEQRGKVSERERFLIEATYYQYATGELEKAAQTYELWERSYPRYELPHVELGLVSLWLGNWQRALEEFHEAMRLEPNNGINYLNLAIAYAVTNRLEEAEQVYREADKRHLENELMLQSRYWLAFLKGDSKRMAQLYSAAIGKPGAEDLLLAAQADTEGWYGRLDSARELTSRAMSSAQRNQAPESAAAYRAAAALREVEAGLQQSARADALAALKLAPTRDVQAIAALALARAGDTARAESLANVLDQSFPFDTIVQRTWLPSIRASLALQHSDPKLAVQMLHVAEPIELGVPSNITIYMCPAYVRGQAYLMLNDSHAAAAEFQKFIDNPGVALNFPWAALAHLGLARAYAIQAKTDSRARVQARAAYGNFLRLWKDADLDLPILKQAKAEHSRLAPD